MNYKLLHGIDHVYITVKQAAKIIDAIENGQKSIFVGGHYIADAKNIRLVPDYEGSNDEVKSAPEALIRELESIGSNLVRVGASLEEPKVVALSQIEEEITAEKQKMIAERTREIAEELRDLVK